MGKGQVGNDVLLLLYTLGLHCRHLLSVTGLT